MTRGLPYLTDEKGRRIRQAYNQAVTRYRKWCAAHVPQGAPLSEWLRWRTWITAWEDALLARRDDEIKLAIEQHRKDKHDKRRHRYTGPRRGS